MSRQPVLEECYADNQGRVSWIGVRFGDEEAFDQLLAADVASRVHDKAGEIEFETHLQGLVTTGFEQDGLQALLDAAKLEERDWAIGEALAEVHLSREHGIAWPWNSERDKRTPLASLPGADLVGLMDDGEGALLVLGEVKCSSEQQHPPQVMSGRSGGMVHQLDKLAEDLELLRTLLRWLLPRCKGTVHEPAFNLAMRRLLGSGNRAVALFGVLVRDTEPNQKDLCVRGRDLASRISAPTACRLTALHVPCRIEQLPARMLGGVV